MSRSCAAPHHISVGTKWPLRSLCYVIMFCFLFCFVCLEGYKSTRNVPKKLNAQLSSLVVLLKLWAVFCETWYLLTWSLCPACSDFFFPNFSDWHPSPKRSLLLYDLGHICFSITSWWWIHRVKTIKFQVFFSGISLLLQVLWVFYF